MLKLPARRGYLWGFFAAVLIAFTIGSIFIHSHHAMAQTNESKTATTNTNTSTDTSTAETDLRKKLTPEQYRVTQECGTEPPFRNAYWDNHKPGIYVDVVSGKPLFTSLDKFDSGSGWPSFTKPIAKENVVEKNDASHGMERTEVRGADSNSHLGHLFDDGPREKGGMRYCVNSAALRFVPVEKLKEEGYGEFLPLFEKQQEKNKSTAAQ